MGAKSMTAGFLIVLAWLLSSYGVFTSNFLWRLPFAFLFALACAGAGKSLGIFLARRRLRLELDQLY
jgi:apolipoprotein N-acyltransferase